MRVTLKILLMFYICSAKCTVMDSHEFNHIELTPIHDAIIFNDIANIMNELENNMNHQFDNNMFSNSESDEDVEDLLSEYQQYLDKAHEQTVNYIRKSKGKNKIPQLRHEKFTKLKAITRSGFDGNNYYFDDMKHPPATFINKYIPNVKPVKTSRDENKLINFPPLLPKSLPELVLSSCYCRENVIPCTCGCKQCLAIDSAIPNTFNKLRTDQNLFTSFLKPSMTLPEDNSNNDNNLNIRIKIDVQLPNISRLNYAPKHQNQYRTIERDDPTEITRTINFPFPYLNFPIPMELIGYKQNVFKDNSSPEHKITIHKKKKYRLSNNNKKHKNKKLITLHHIKIEPEMQQNITIEHQNNSKSSNNNSINMNEGTKLIKNISQNVEIQINTTLAPQTEITNNQTFDTIYLTLNISKENENHTEDLTKSENSIETDTPSDKDNMTTLKTLRVKREIVELTSKNVAISNIAMTTSSNAKSKIKTSSSQVNVTKNSGINSVADTELTYWPSALKNQSLIPSKNITALILDREIRKAKLNMTETNIRNNRTMALEKAIFGNVDWNDVDVVVPVFMSFVGKYIRGVLTFCSESECHSMKCADKICHHRICSPENRYNQIGHCAGNNNTDSVATMESIMDLPSNVAFEIVDILQDKMIGKLFGKVTLCINSKCSAFAAFKKKFQKAKCSFKDLNSTGHCSNLKNVKNI